MTQSKFPANCLRDTTPPRTKLRMWRSGLSLNFLTQSLEDLSQQPPNPFKSVLKLTGSLDTCSNSRIRQEKSSCQLMLASFAMLSKELVKTAPCRGSLNNCGLHFFNSS